MPLHTVPGSFASQDKVETDVTNRTGGTLAVGEIVAFDLDASDGDTTAYATDPLSIFANVIAPATKHLKGGYFAVVTDLLDGAGADNTKVRVATRGVVDVSCVGSSTVAINDGVMPANGVKTITKLTDGLTSVGLALETGPTGTAASNIAVLFNGDCRNGAAGAASV